MQQHRQKHHRKTEGNKQDNKNKKSLPKRDFKNQAYEESNFCQAFSGMENPTNMQKHRQKTEKKTLERNKTAKPKVRTLIWISKPNLGRR